MTKKHTSFKAVEKLSKYEDLENVETKTTTVPVVTGALGLVKKGTENYISKIPGNIGKTDHQKIALLGYCSHTQEVTIHQVTHETFHGMNSVP